MLLIDCMLYVILFGLYVFCLIMLYFSGICLLSVCIVYFLMWICVMMKLIFVKVVFGLLVVKNLMFGVFFFKNILYVFVICFCFFLLLL